nr:cell division protein CrgA [Nesterenkonia sandarakina]
MTRRPRPAPPGCPAARPGYRTEIRAGSRGDRTDVAESKQRKNRRTRGKTETKKSPLNDADPKDVRDLDLEDESLPLWYRATMIGLMILGLLWMIVWYITQGAAPVQAAGGWNIIIGFGIAMVGFFMTMRWK